MDTLTKEERSKYIIYICDNINELKTNHRKEILQIILYSNIDNDKIVEKGNGTQIIFSHLNDILVKNIYNYIYNKSEIGQELI